MIDPAALASEIHSDPAHLGYAAPLAAGQDGVIADLLNAATGPGTGTVPIPTLSKGAFLIGMLPAVQALGNKDAATQAQWDRMLQIACATDPIDVGNPGVQAILAAAQQQGLLTGQQAAAVTTRTGSRAEVLFGAGTIVTHTDVARALGNLGKVVLPAGQE